MLAQQLNIRCPSTKGKVTSSGRIIMMYKSGTPNAAQSIKYIGELNQPIHLQPVDVSRDDHFPRPIVSLAAHFRARIYTETPEQPISSPYSAGPLPAARPRKENETRAPTTRTSIVHVIGYTCAREILIKAGCRPGARRISPRKICKARRERPRRRSARQCRKPPLPRAVDRHPSPRSDPLAPRAPRPRPSQPRASTTISRAALTAGPCGCSSARRARRLCASRESKPGGPSAAAQHPPGDSGRGWIRRSTRTAWTLGGTCFFEVAFLGARKLEPGSLIRGCGVGAGPRRWSFMYCGQPRSCVSMERAAGSRLLRKSRRGSWLRGWCEH